MEERKCELKLNEIYEDLDDANIKGSDENTWCDLIENHGFEWVYNYVENRELSLKFIRLLSIILLYVRIITFMGISQNQVSRFNQFPTGLHCRNVNKGTQISL